MQRLTYLENTIKVGHRMALRCRLKMKFALDRPLVLKIAAVIVKIITAKVSSCYAFLHMYQPSLFLLDYPSKSVLINNICHNIEKCSNASGNELSVKPYIY